MPRFSKEELYRIRNEISVRWVIEEVLEIPRKDVEGVFRFLCPCCGEFQTGVHIKANLSRCFRCERNFNVIELVMLERKTGFVESVKFLQGKHRHFLGGTQDRDSVRSLHSGQIRRSNVSYNGTFSDNTQKELLEKLLWELAH